MRRLAAAALIIAMPSLAVAQETKPCVFDTAAHRDIDTVTLYVRAHAPDDTAINLQATRIVGALLRDRWHPPATIGRMFYPYTKANPARAAARSPASGSFNVPAYHGRFDLRIAAGDLVQAVALRSTTGDSATDSSFMATLVPSRSAPAGNGRTVNLVVDLVSSPEIDDQPVLNLVVPWILVDGPLQQFDVHAPLYPPFERASRIGGYATIAFIVDENGHIDPTNMYAVEATRPAFAASAKSAILAAHYRPAMVAACAVKTRVEQRVVYTIGDR